MCVFAHAYIYICVCMYIYICICACINTHEHTQMCKGVFKIKTTPFYAFVQNNTIFGNLEQLGLTLVTKSRGR